MWVAVGLLAAATLVVAAALVNGERWALAAAAVVALLAGAAATRIVTNELAQARRDAARDRAKQAMDYQTLAAERVREHTAFSARMAARMANRDAIILRLRRALRVALRRVDEAEDRVRREARVVAELQATVHDLRTRLDSQLGDPAEPDAETADALASWDGDAPTVVDLMGWDQRASESVGSPAEDTRKHA